MAVGATGSEGEDDGGWAVAMANTHTRRFEKDEEEEERSFWWFGLLIRRNEERCANKRGRI